MQSRFASSIVLMLNLALAYVAGVISILGFFTRGTFSDLGGTLAQWVAVLVAFAVLVGLGNLMKVHIGRAVKRETGWFYSLVTVASALTVIALGLLNGGPGGPAVAWVFQWIYQPLGAAIFSLLALFLTTALFRTYRMRSLEAVVILAAALIVIIGLSPSLLAVQLPEVLGGIKDWILDYPVLAAVRAILLGVAFGAIATSIRVLMGLDRPYLE